MVDANSVMGIWTTNLESIPWYGIVLVIILFAFKFIWYGIALYKTIERKQAVWFTILFVGTAILADLGLLAIIYLLLYKEKDSVLDKKAVPKKKKR